MAARIPLILCQPPRREAAAIDLIENIVAAAMLIPGLDANLIGDIETFEPGGTDHLCLQGHTRDVVLASFLDLRAAQAAWQRLGQSGHFIDFAASEEKIRGSLRAEGTLRKVFYFQLMPHQSVSVLLDQCQKLLAAQQLSLVTIALGPSGLATSPRGSGLPIVNGGQPVSAGPVSAKPGVSQPMAFRSVPIIGGPAAAQSHAADSSTGRPAAAGPVWETAVAASSQAGHEEDDDWSALDKLVDDLDAMDL